VQPSGEQKYLELTLMVKQPPDPPQLDDASPIPDDLQTMFGRNLRAARMAQGLKQADLAEKAGINQQYVSSIEAGQINLTLDTVKRLAAALGQDALVLLGAPSLDRHEPDT